MPKMRKSKYLCLRCNHIYMAWDIFCTKCGSYAARRLINPRKENQWPNIPAPRESNGPASKK